MSKAATDRRSFLKMTAAAGAGLSWSGRGLVGAAETAGSPFRAQSEARLFLDDAVIDVSRGLRRVLHRPRKMGLIQEADGRPWDRGGLISVVRDCQGRFHMTYYLHYWDPSVRNLHPSIGDDKAHWFRMPVAYATSEDGRRWRKPVLGLVEGPAGFRRAPQSKWKDGQFEEPTGLSKENNLGSPLYSIRDVGQFHGLPDPQRRCLVNVIRMDDDHAFAKIIDGGLYFASDVPNLKDPQWRRHMEVIWEGPKRGPRGHGVNVGGYDSTDQLWFECNQSSFGGFQRRGGRDIARWTSQDLQNWSDEELVLPIADDESRRPEDYVEYMAISVHRAGDAWLGLLLIFHGDRRDPQGEMPTQKGVWRKGLTDLRLIVSRDAGKTWRRVSGKDVWLAPHQAEDGYDRLLGMTFAPVRVGDELWLYYGCWDGDHLSWNKDGTTYYKDRARIWRTALATMRWDGYVSLRADQTGTLTTRPLSVQGGGLAINADAKGGEVRVELQDAAGKPIRGFTLDDCERLIGDSVTWPVRWRGGGEPPRAVAAQPLRLRFLLQKADLYGFRFLT